MISVARLRVVLAAVALCLVGNAWFAHATGFSDLLGIVHDPQHRPIAGVHVTAAAANSAFTQSAETNADGAFTLLNVPLGDYNVTVVHAGFATLQQSPSTLASRRCCTSNSAFCLFLSPSQSQRRLRRSPR